MHENYVYNSWIQLIFCVPAKQNEIHKVSSGTMTTKTKKKL